ncbi:MAG: DNA repair protein RadA [Rhizobiaceae bacterium]|nr:DNA repair protein RadA [Rhizobiaceae bacterium]
MAKEKSVYTCTECGGTNAKWLGKCPHCGAWNTLVESVAESAGKPRYAAGRGLLPVEAVSTLAEIEATDADRQPTGIDELDRALGGGIVAGGVILIGGDPGIGKSTLLMQAAAGLSRGGHRVVYVSGEEAVAQVRLRAQRLKAADTVVLLLADTIVEEILATLGYDKRPDLVIIDSIQTLWSDMAESAPGTVTQVRTGVQALVKYAKSSGAAVILVGHVTKDGQIAGPRVVEHMVDAVLYFEGEGGHHFRILRTVKNRFGPTDEIGVFEMSDIGLREVQNPSELFLGERNAKAPGAAVFAGMEGTRPVLVEIQALVAPSALGTPRRAVVGWDQPRLAMVLAVLEAHCAVRLGQHDVYLNVAGGFRISEPAADLAVAAALVSSLSGLALPSDCVYFGEISLSGAVRPVAHSAQRVKEAEKLGFGQAVLPSLSADLPKGRDVTIHEVEHLPDLVARVAGGAGVGGDPTRRTAED